MCLLPEVREIALTGSEILACGSSEIIHCVDIEITAGTAVVKESPSGADSTLCTPLRLAVTTVPRGF